MTDQTGDQCPMCPVEFRNLSAVVHNLLNRLNSNSTLCDVAKKFHSLASAVHGLEVDSTDNETIKKLIEVAKRAAKSTTLNNLLDIKDDLQDAYSPVKVICDNHFSDHG